MNAIYRLGAHLCARLPRVGRWAGDLAKEWRWLPKLAPHLSLWVPQPVGHGHPEGSYPFTWAIYRWLDGQPYADELADDEHQAARDLARFVAELRRIAPVGAPRGGRKPIRALNAVTRAGIESARGVIDSDAGPHLVAASRPQQPRLGLAASCLRMPTTTPPRVDAAARRQAGIMQRIVVGTGMARAASPFGRRCIGAEVTVDDAAADPAGLPTPPTSRVSPTGRSGG